MVLIRSNRGLVSSPMLMPGSGRRPSSAHTHTRDSKAPPLIQLRKTSHTPFWNVSGMSGMSPFVKHQHFKVIRLQKADGKSLDSAANARAHLTSKVRTLLVLTTLGFGFWLKVRVRVKVRGSWSSWGLAQGHKSNVTSRTLKLSCVTALRRTSKTHQSARR